MATIHHRLAISHSNTAYEAIVGQGLLAEDAWLAPHLEGVHDVVIIADATVDTLYGNCLAAQVARHRRCLRLHFPASEAHKTRETKARLEDAMIEANIGRDALVLALGGGVTTDLAGFVASTYKRGLPYLNIPTTTMAMADAAVGGKTAINTHHGKNLIGSFHPPRAVIIDIDTLTTLPPEYQREGLVEMIKHTILADAEGFAAIESTWNLAPGPLPPRSIWPQWIAQSLATKAAIIGEDGRDHGRRQLLNLGHSFGHALEAWSQYTIRHGDAVAWGIKTCSQIAEQRGLMPRDDADRVCRLLDQVLVAQGFATDAAPAVDELLAYLRHDKKNPHGHVRLVLPAALGCLASLPQRQWWHDEPWSQIRV